MFSMSRSRKKPIEDVETPNLLPRRHIPEHLRRNGKPERGRVSDLYPDLHIAKAAVESMCSRSCLSMILRGERNGSPRLLERIASTLEMSTDQLANIRTRAKHEIR
jgi:hypothetical protein